MTKARRLRALAQVLKERFGSLTDLEKERPPAPKKPHPNQTIKGKTNKKK